MIYFHNAPKFLFINLNFLRILEADKEEFGDDVFFKALPLVKSDDKKSEKVQKWPIFATLYTKNIF